MDKTQVHTVLVEAYTLDEYVEDQAQFAVVHVSLEDLEKMEKVLEAVKGFSELNNVSISLGDCYFYPAPVKAEDCDLLAVDGSADYDESDFVDIEDGTIRVEWPVAVVSARGDLQYKTLLKHTDVHVNSAWIYIGDIKAAILMKKEDAPKYLNDESFMLRERAKKLLSKGGGHEKS